MVSALFDSAHGAGLSVVMPAWLEVVSSTDEKGCTRVAKFAINVFGVNPDLTDLKGVPDEGIRRFRCWLADISMPASLSELGIEQSDMDTLVAHAGFGGNGQVGGYRMFTKEELVDFYQSIL